MNKKLLAYLSTDIIPIDTTLKSVKRSETNPCILITQAFNIREKSEPYRQL